MMDIFKNFFFFLMTPECYTEYFINFNFFHGECIKTIISKVLGMIIIAGSVTVKVPQILKIINNKSGEGIAVMGVMFELSAITSFFSYSYLKQFPFSAWGDGLFLAIQTVIVICLIFYYKNQLMHLVLFLSIYSTLVFSIVTGITPISFLWAMQILNLPIIILGKGIQALINYRNQSTGQLSAITCWMQFGGSAARVFTSVQETGDTAVILSFVVASILNGIIVFQLLYYASFQKKGKEKVKGRKFD